VLYEPENSVLRTYLDGADLITCELALIEIPHAIRRAPCLAAWVASSTRTVTYVQPQTLHRC
jgi:hypothetical protein